MMYAYSENFVLPLSHDEVVHGKGSVLGKMPGDDWKKFATLRALFSYLWAHPGKQLLFMGSEFGQRGEWSQESGLDWAALLGPAHVGLQRLVSDLNRTYRQLPALWRGDLPPPRAPPAHADAAVGHASAVLPFAHAARLRPARPPRPPPPASPPPPGPPRPRPSARRSCPRDPCHAPHRPRRRHRSMIADPFRRYRRKVSVITRVAPRKRLGRHGGYPS